MENYSNVLSQLKKINEEAVIICYVPSAKRDVKFKPMTVAQQQQLIKGINSESSDNLRITNCINDTLVANCLEQIDIKLIDREIILLGYKLNDAGISTEEKNSISEAIKAIKDSGTFEDECQISAYGIKVNCTIPSLGRDNIVNSGAIKAIESNKNAKTGSLISTMYRYQIIKFISSIEVSKEEVSFEDVSDLASLLTIIDNIPADLNNAVLAYSTRVQSAFAEILKHKNITVQTPTL